MTQIPVHPSAVFSEARNTWLEAPDGLPAVRRCTTEHLACHGPEAVDPAKPAPDGALAGTGRTVTRAVRW